MSVTKNDEDSRKLLETVWDAPFKMLSASLDAMMAASLFVTGATRAHLDFLKPFLVSSDSFLDEEGKKLVNDSLIDSALDYMELARFNAQITREGLKSSQEAMSEYHKREFIRLAFALFNTLSGGKGETVDEYMADKAEAFKKLVVDYPDAIRDIKDEYGFHPEHEGYNLVAETDRMELHQVLPTEPGIEIRNDLKPIIITHPYVLGPNIIVFLPNEKKSYVHAYANQGIPTYIRVNKDIQTSEALQVATGEDDARDTAYFSRIVKEKHGKLVTLNGFCQGGFILLADILSGELDGLVDALITCAAPMDGTRSESLTEYLSHISPRFQILLYSTKTLPIGNEVVDVQFMSWVYKLKSIWREAPLFTYYKDIERFETMLKKGGKGISKTAAAINHWLIYDRTDLPIPITQMSFDSYTIPISNEGDLPFKLFDRRLSFDYIKEKNIRFLICYGLEDDLVDPPSALAPRDYVEAELTAFPKGHAAIATSWSHPESEYAVHKTFPNGQRGPVRFQLDLNKETD